MGGGVRTGPQLMVTAARYCAARWEAAIWDDTGVVCALPSQADTIARKLIQFCWCARAFVQRLDDAVWMQRIHRAVNAARSIGIEPGDRVAERIVPSY